MTIDIYKEKLDKYSSLIDFYAEKQVFIMDEQVVKKPTPLFLEFYNKLSEKKRKLVNGNIYMNYLSLPFIRGVKLG
jgi:hypothetical protein